MQNFIEIGPLDFEKLHPELFFFFILKRSMQIWLSDKKRILIVIISLLLPLTSK